MTTEREEATWVPVEPQTLIKGFKCAVCWEYFDKPHTLACGHTFCIRCLQLLVRVLRTSRTRTPLDRLRFRCPSCRKMTGARPILRRRAAINYAINELLEEWFKSPYSSGKVEFLTVRSVASQTENSDIEEVTLPRDIANENEQNNGDPNISQEEFREILFHRIKPHSSIETKVRNAVTHELQLQGTNDNGLPDDIVVSSSSDDNESEQEIGPHLQGLQVINDYGIQTTQRQSRFRFISIFAIWHIIARAFLTVFNAIRQSRSRTVFTLFWFIYGTLIVCISTAFLPWMIIYTFIYFVIIYSETIPSYTHG